MRNPKDVLVWEFAPGKKLVQFTITLRNVKGALAICSQALAQYNINLFSGFHTAPSSSSLGTWSFFADATASTFSPEHIGERLRSLPFVESVVIRESKNGFLVDDGHFPVRWAGRRVVMIRTEAVVEMLARLWDVFGSGAVTIIREMGEAMGRFMALEIVSDFGTDFAVENLSDFLNAYTALGMADLEIESYDRGKGTLCLVARELFECDGGFGSGGAKSVFFRGHLSGFMSKIFGAPFDVVETECVGSGGKACRFQVSNLAVPRQQLATRKDKSR